jgi:hypothetical protein
MASIRDCWNDACEYNRGGCYCDAWDVEISTDGRCLTFKELDIYKEEFSNGNNTCV